MKKNLAIVITIISLTGLTSMNATAQDIHFSQFYENAILRNPALTGIFSGDFKAGVNYRNQWSQISVPFRTVLASAETRIAVNPEVGDYLSFGVSATYDRAGAINFNSMQVYPAVNFNKALEDKHNSYLSLGFTGGYIQRSVDLSKATFSSQYGGGGYDPLASSGEQISHAVISNYDLGVGVSMNSSVGEANNINYYVGLAGYHLTKPKQSFSQDELIRLDTKIVGNFGIKCDILDRYAFTGHFNYLAQGHYREVIAGGLFSWHSNPETEVNFAVYGGVFVRFKDAIIPTVKIDYKNYSFTTSYDLNTSSLKPASNGMGGVEMSLYVRGNYKKSARNGYQTRCPRFEDMMQSSLQSF